MITTSFYIGLALLFAGMWFGSTDRLPARWRTPNGRSAQVAIGFGITMFGVGLIAGTVYELAQLPS